MHQGRINAGCERHQQLVSVKSAYANEQLKYELYQFIKLLLVLIYSYLHQQ